jgi:hypothetical protein
MTVLSGYQRDDFSKFFLRRLYRSCKLDFPTASNAIRRLLGHAAVRHGKLEYTSKEALHAPIPQWPRARIVQVTNLLDTGFTTCDSETSDRDPKRRYNPLPIRAWDERGAYVPRERRSTCGRILVLGTG